MYKRVPDVTRQWFRDAELAMLTARMLEHMTGDSCATIWQDHGRFTIARQSPDGKIIDG